MKYINTSTPPAPGKAAVSDLGEQVSPTPGRAAIPKIRFRRVSISKCSVPFARGYVITGNEFGLPSLPAILQNSAIWVPVFRFWNEIYCLFWMTHETGDGLSIFIKIQTPYLINAPYLLFVAESGRKRKIRSTFLFFAYWPENEFPPRIDSPNNQILDGSCRGVNDRNTYD